MELLKLTPTFGVEVRGLCITTDTNQGVMLELRELLFENLVLVFRDQKLTPEDLIRFCGYFGRLAESFDRRFELNGYPLITVVGRTKEASGQDALLVNNRVEWHYDFAHMPEPALAAALYCRIVPASGGDTLLADTRSAYSALAEKERAALDGLRAVYSTATLNRILDGNDPNRNPESAPKFAPVEREIVQTHPITGRQAILIAPEIMAPINARDGIIEDLLSHCTDHAFLYRHKWREGDLLLYDNLSTIHTATEVPIHDYERVVYRTTMLLSPPASS